jgi:hypothetical protein
MFYNMIHNKYKSYYIKFNNNENIVIKVINHQPFNEWKIQFYHYVLDYVKFVKGLGLMLIHKIKIILYQNFDIREQTNKIQ